uniref:ATP synthase F0 subunit 6 n=1 Tax=Eleutherocaulis alte TaxID=74076 RepID=A0A1P7YWA0_9EUPU|nr:ATP synthase F0 subunit 6 [Eleutherocaulis alte]
MLAISRTAKVIGRIKTLIVSMMTNNGIKMTGVPEGAKWAMVFLMLFVALDKINISHKENDSETANQIEVLNP